MSDYKFKYYTSPFAVPFAIVLLILHFVVGIQKILANHLSNQFLADTDFTLYVIVVAGVCFLYGSLLVTTEFDPALKQIVRKRLVFFVIPVLSKTVSFKDVRHIDFHHPQDGNLLTSTNYFGRGDYEGGGHEGAPYELYLCLESHEKYLIIRNHGRERMADLGKQLARMTRSRMT